jgi:hypothetical protein
MIHYPIKQGANVHLWAVHVFDMESAKNYESLVPLHPAAGKIRWCLSIAGFVCAALPTLDPRIDGLCPLAAALGPRAIDPRPVHRYPFSPCALLARSSYYRKYNKIDEIEK